MENASPASEQPRFRVEVGRAQLLGAAIGIGILGFLVALPLFYFKAEIHSWGKLLGCSAGVGVITGVIARLRGGAKEKRVTVGEEGVSIENEKERIQLPWPEVEQINHWMHGDHYWEFVSPHRARPIVLKGFGFSKHECEHLSQTLRHYKRFVEEEVGAKRILEDAFVH